MADVVTSPRGRRLERRAASGDELSVTSLGGLSRLIFNFRLLTLLITAIYIPFRGGDALPVVLAWLFAAIFSLVGVERWDSIGAALMKHPSYLALDLVVAIALLAVIGVTSPFFYFTLGTALLAGALYGWIGAAVFSGLLLAGYWSAFAVQSSVIEGLRSFGAMVGNPALYPLAAGGGAALRDLLIKKRVAEAAVEEASRTAAIERERSRIAREMHDSLAKTLHGMSLSAVALEQWIERNPARAGEEARHLATAAQGAAAEAREIIRDLRADVLSVSLSSAVETYAREWSSRTGIDVDLALSEADDASPASRWELFRILKEALDNVERHACAGHVAISLAPDDGELALEVRDDGRGFTAPARTTDFAANGHFGVVGMAERAESTGGRFELHSDRDGGTAIVARVPVDFDGPGEPSRRA